MSESDGPEEIFLYFANGVFVKALSFGVKGSAVGEVVFNTSLCGYQEIITDPSYAGQFVTFTMPEIGIVGVNDCDIESRSVFCKGIIIANYNSFYSNFRAQASLDDFLKKHNTIGIYGIDTRAIVKMLRTQGAMMMAASTEFKDKSTLKSLLDSTPNIQELNLIPEVSTKEPYRHQYGSFDFVSFNYDKPTTKRNKKIAVIDFGVKQNILNELVAAGLDVKVLPYDFSAQEIITSFRAKRIGGVFLSNGPGDPLMLDSQIAQIRLLIDANIPMFGICLGHQLLAIAHGFDTYKLKFGHHGGNHPVKNMLTQQVEITSQNHNYSVPDSIESIAKVTHRNLFDGTIEGLYYFDKPIFSIQHHPEASPGPRESRSIFLEFAKIVQECEN